MRKRIGVLAGISAAAGLLFLQIVRSVADHTSVPFDANIRTRFLGARTPWLDDVSTIITAISAPALLVTAMLAMSFGLRKRGLAVWLPLASSPLAAMTAGRLFSSTLPQQYAPDSKEDGCEPCFPSGHTTGFMAEAITTAYVLRREKLLGTGAALLLIVLPSVAGLNRLYRDRHWATDVLAGLSAGTVVGSLCAIAYERLAASPLTAVTAANLPARTPS